MREISINDWTLFGGGMNGESYSCNNDPGKVLKVYPEHTNAETVLREYEINDALYKKGISCPQVIEIVTCGGRVGLISERINNKISFCKAAGQNPEMIAPLAQRLANMAIELHRTPGAEAPFTSAVDFYAGLADKMNLDPEQRRAAAAALEILRREDCKTLVHGDFHYGNVITDGVKDYFIDLGDCRYGNPDIDIAMFYFAVHFLPDPLYQIVYHLDKSCAMEFWNVFKDAYYKGNAPTDESLFSTLRPYLFFITLGLEDRCGADDTILGLRQRLTTFRTF